jgi:hypothetical protein
MSVEEKVRNLLAPADPARGLGEQLPTVPALELVVRAETQSLGESRPRSLPRRRLILAGSAAALAVGAAAGAGLLPSRTSRGRTDATGDADSPPAGASPLSTAGAEETAGDGVVRLMAFELDDSGTAAGPHLRELAARLAPAPYDRGAGRYNVLHYKDWGSVGVTSGSFTLRQAFEVWRWAADGEQRTVSKSLPPWFQDEASARYWKTHSQPPSRVIDFSGSGPRPATSLPFADLSRPIPTDPAALADELGVAEGAEAVRRRLATLHASRGVPLANRAAVLRVLAGMPGWTWKGPVTDRLGRPGVAITATGLEDAADAKADGEARQRLDVLVFDPQTGELLSIEVVAASEDGRDKRKLDSYVAYYPATRSDTLG